MTREQRRARRDILAERPHKARQAAMKREREALKALKREVTK